MGNKLNLIIIDESLRDVARIARELAAQDFAPVVWRVESAGGFETGPPDSIVPDVILSEWHPYGLNGFALLARCRERHPGVPFVFVTHRVDPGLIVELSENGAAGHVSKRELGSIGGVVRTALAAGEQDSAVVELPLQPDLTGATAKSGTETASLLPQTNVPADVHPLCPTCKRVGDERGLWAPIELHLRVFARATVELAECPQCRQVGRAG